MTDKPDGKRQWVILFLVSLGTAAAIGIPLGFVVAIVVSLTRGDSIRDWNVWATWAMCTVPLAVGIVTFVMGIPFVRWNASARIKRRVLAIAAIWLGCLVLMLASIPFAVGKLLGVALLIIASATTLRIWPQSD